MQIYHKRIEDVSHGLITVQKAVDKYLSRPATDAIRNENILAEDCTRVYTGATNENAEINASDIQTKLIQITGRFCERYASDLICILSDLDPFLHHIRIDKSDRWTIAVGIRESGVDGNLFLLSRLKETERPPFGYVSVSANYRKVLAIDIQDTVSPDGGQAIRFIRLLDITSNLLTIDPADKEEST